MIELSFLDFSSGGGNLNDVDRCVSLFSVSVITQSRSVVHNKNLVTLIFQKVLSSVIKFSDIFKTFAHQNDTFTIAKAIAYLRLHQVSRKFEQFYSEK